MGAGALGALAIGALLVVLGADMLGALAIGALLSMLEAAGAGGLDIASGSADGATEVVMTEVLLVVTVSEELLSVTIAPGLLSVVTEELLWMTIVVGAGALVGAAATTGAESVEVDNATTLLSMAE